MAHRRQRDTVVELTHRNGGMLGVAEGDHATPWQVPGGAEPGRRRQGRSVNSHGARAANTFVLVICAIPENACLNHGPKLLEHVQ